MSGADNYRCVLVPGNENLEATIRGLPGNFERTGDTLYKARNVLKRYNWGQKKVIVKSFAIPNWLNRFLYRWIRKSKAQRAFEHALELSTRGIATPSPIGYLECVNGFHLTRSFYAYEEWSADFTLRDCLMNPDYPDRLGILTALGEFAWQMHQQQINFLDFSPGNILVRWKSSKSFCLVDINRMRFQALSFQERMRTFSRLWANDGDLETIVVAYALVSGEDVDIAKALAIHYSETHKERSLRKEKIKSLLNLH